MQLSRTIEWLAALAAWHVATSAFCGEFKFQHHFIDRDLPGTSYGQTCLVDVDQDGDLDFITGGKGPNLSVYWFEFQGPDKWVRHDLGTHHPSDVGGTAIDVDGDGWLDHVTGGVWYRNTRQPRTEPFERIVFDGELKAVHDLIAADVDRDGRLDIITMSDKNNLRWYRIPKDSHQPWERHDIGPGVHAGAAVGDIDGDGDLDLARSNAWFENADGKGATWIEHPIPFGNPRPPYPLATRCVIIDINQDGQNDLVMTENEIRAGKIAWLDNRGGKGLDWVVQELSAGDTAPRGAYHSLAVADFDRDGDQDVFTVEMEAIPGARLPRWFVWENVDGRGAIFHERVILDNGLGGHEAVVADVDGDGDLDICSKLWRPRRDNANGGRNHADFVENLVLKPAVREASGGAEVIAAGTPWIELSYSPSDGIAGIEFDRATRRTEAQGSDIWPITWADDDHQYAAYGDGAGFGVTSAREQSGANRASLGVSRIEGDWRGYQGKNAWGGKNAENPAQFPGKGTGIICVEGVLYMWVGSPDGRLIEQTQLAVSHDHSRTWKLSDWQWTMHDRLFCGVFLNFGRNDSGARDGYVYSYFTRIETTPPRDQPRSWIHETPGLVDLSRVPKNRLIDRGAYEWFAGISGDGSPIWTANMALRKPVFVDPNGIKIVSVCRAPGINRYLLAYNPRDNSGNFGLFEAAEPWGPWKQVAYLHDQKLFMPPEPNFRVSVFHFAPKWWSSDGREFTLIFNTGDDAWNTIRGKLITP